jgi:hypothetical protein
MAGSSGAGHCSFVGATRPRSVALPRNTYGREKRQKELNRQRKREEKQQRKLDRAAARAEQPDPAEPGAPGALPADLGSE